VDELRSEDVTLRLNAVHRISTISLALGTERTRTELIPFLLESLDDDDEILLALAEELGQNFVEYVGGDQYAHLLLPVLEILAAVEETLVRDKAADSITKICAALSEAQIEEYYLPLLKRLSTGEWFTSRTSATALFAAAYLKAGQPARDEMRKMFTTLCSDDTPMVRRAAAKELGGFSKTLSHDVLLSDLLPAFRKLSQDDQDSVRLLTVDSLISIAEALSNEECKTYLGSTMKAMVSDKSWRVRYMVADHFVKLATAAGEDIVREELVVAFVALLKDNEAEVRTAAAGQIPGTLVSRVWIGKKDKRVEGRP
jgi:serine/threonine-protein phosphatase 2A regulatory subunit A